MKSFHYKVIILFILFLNQTNLYAKIVKIMPLGDSITYDNRHSDEDDPRPSSQRTAYRSHLWYKLQAAGYAADFVGSRVAGQSIQPPFDPDNEGHPGWTSFEIAAKTYTYMSNSNPDIVLLHIGTNDVSTTAPTGVESILNEIDLYEQESGHSVLVIAALIIDRREDDGRIRIFNERLEGMLVNRIINGDKIVIVDMYRNAGLTRRDYVDNTHPNSNGYNKMASLWFNAIMRPYNPTLSTFPYTLVSPHYIENITINSTATSVEFTTEVPDNGIIF